MAELCRVQELNTGSGVSWPLVLGWLGVMGECSKPGKRSAPASPKRRKS